MEILFKKLNSLLVSILQSMLFEVATIESNCGNATFTGVTTVHLEINFL